MAVPGLAIYGVSIDSLDASATVIPPCLVNWLSSRNQS